MFKSAPSGFTLAKQIALYQQHLDKKFCDIVIKIQDEEYFVHSCIVAAASLKLQKILEENQTMVDVKGRPSIEVELNDSVFTTKNFEFILSYIYLGILDWEKVTPDLVSEILTAAEWCGFDQVTEDYMSRKNMTDETEKNSAPETTVSVAVVLDSVPESEDDLSSDSITFEGLTDYYSAASQSQETLFCIFCGEQFDSANKEDFSQHMKMHDGKKSEPAASPVIKSTRRKASLNIKRKYQSLIPNSRGVEDDDDEDSDEFHVNEIDYMKKIKLAKKRTKGLSIKLVSNKKTSQSKLKKKKAGGSRSVKGSVKVKITKKSPLKSKKNNEHVCKECNKTYASKKSLSVHMRRHKKKDVDESENGSLNGDIIVEAGTEDASGQNANRRTKKKPAKARTIKKEKNVKEYPCPHCQDVVFFKRREMVAHVRAQHGIIKKHSCEHCGKLMGSKVALEVHTRIHTGVRPFVCPQCGQGFSERHTMENHQRRHTGERPFLCTICGKDFAFRQSLYRHVKFHEGERPHQCHVCGKSFVLRQNLNEHVARHDTTMRPSFDCPSCSKKFRTGRSLKKHQESAHLKPTTAKQEQNFDEEQSLAIYNLTREGIETLDKQAAYEVTIEDTAFEQYED